MSMFCYQCQETARNTACTKVGVCGKPETLAHLMDMLIYSLKGLAWIDTNLLTFDRYYPEDCLWTMQGLFRTITTANFN